jgi:hypothetical protein
MESWRLPDMSPLLRHFFKALHWISVPSFTTTMSRTQVSSDSSTYTLDSNSSSDDKRRDRSRRPNLFQQPPTFSQLCASLQRNDPLTTEIRTDHSFPDGYGRLLGEAIQENTSVQTISLELHKFACVPMHKTRHRKRLPCCSFFVPIRF